MMKLDSFLLIFIILILYVILIFLLNQLVGKEKTTENCTNACPCEKNAPLNKLLS